VTTIEERPAPPASRVHGWRLLAGVTAMLNVAVFAWQGTRGDMEAAAIAVATLAGAALLRWRDGRLGLLVLGAIFTNNLIWMFPAANTNASFRAGLDALAIPASISALSLAGLIGVIAALVRRNDPDAGRGAATGTGVIVIGMVAAGFALTWAIAPVKPPRIAAGAPRVVSKGVAFEPTSIEAGKGKVAIAIRNSDLFWHTFTIDAAGVDVAVPVGAVRQVTFDAAPGSYTFYCKIPGHARAGMRGTLTVR
jgi:plastocyanin